MYLVRSLNCSSTNDIFDMMDLARRIADLEHVSDAIHARFDAAQDGQIRRARVFGFHFWIHTVPPNSFMPL